MPGVLFWNLHGRKKQNRDGRAASICAALTSLVRSSRERELDVVVFCECLMPEDNVTQALNIAGAGNYHVPPSRSQKIKVWTRLPVGAVRDRYNGTGRYTKRLSIREVDFPGSAPILLAGVHLPDRRSLSNTGREDAARAVAGVIRRVENDRRHSRTVVVGDFNMNPYEPGVVGTEAFHAVMTKELVEVVSGRTARESRGCFYNPMWSVFGDRSPGPAGTYYWNNADDPANHFWQVYDQVLIRPQLLGAFTRVEVLTGDAQQPLVRAGGVPHATTYSDHLPLYCEFSFP